MIQCRAKRTFTSTQTNSTVMNLSLWRFELHLNYTCNKLINAKRHRTALLPRQELILIGRNRNINIKHRIELFFIQNFYVQNTNQTSTRLTN